MNMSERIVPLYYPPGVRQVIGFGSSSFIGLLGDDTVLKYPRIREEHWDLINIEARIYEALGFHPRILAFYGFDERGLQLEHAKNGTVRDLLLDPSRAHRLTTRDRIRLCRQAAEAVAYIHTKKVVHCDISTRNFLLDENMDVKLSDFQGIYTDPDGAIWNGQALENVKAYLPRPSNHSDESSDLFALGSAMYEIMVGHEPFPELNELDDEGEIEERYQNKRFPSVDSVVSGKIISQCWSLAYDQVYVCIKDLKTVEDSLIPYDIA